MPNFYLDGKELVQDVCMRCGDELQEQKCLSCNPSNVRPVKKTWESYYPYTKVPSPYHTVYAGNIGYTGNTTLTGNIITMGAVDHQHPTTKMDKIKADMHILISYVKEEIRHNNNNTHRRLIRDVNETLQGVLEHCEAVLED